MFWGSWSSLLTSLPSAQLIRDHNSSGRMRCSLSYKLPRWRVGAICLHRLDRPQSLLQWICTLWTGQGHSGQISQVAVTVTTGFKTVKSSQLKPSGFLKMKALIFYPQLCKTNKQTNANNFPPKVMQLQNVKNETKRAVARWYQKVEGTPHWWYCYLNQGAIVASQRATFHICVFKHTLIEKWSKQ